MGVSFGIVAPRSVSIQLPKLPLPKATVMVSGAPPAPLVIQSGGMRMAPGPLGEARGPAGGAAVSGVAGPTGAASPGSGPAPSLSGRTQPSMPVPEART